MGNEWKSPPSRVPDHGGGKTGGNIDILPCSTKSFMLIGLFVQLLLCAGFSILKLVG
jgi:hypothetical protein